MKFTPETLRKTCEEYKICGENQDKLVKEFFENYPDIELTEAKSEYRVGRSASYSFNNRVILSLNAPTSASVDLNRECVRPMGAALFWGVTSGCVFLESGCYKPLMHTGSNIKVATDNKVKRKWYEKIKDIFLHTR